jgi:hypothetical protein
MRVMVLVKATEDSEAGVMPTHDELAEMGRFNEELVKAGVRLDGDGLARTSEGKRVRFEGEKTTVLDGPFAETKELVAGYWVWEVASMEEATEWLKRAPFRDAEVEIRRFLTAEDFGPEFTKSMQEREQALRDEAAARHQ